MKILKRRVGIDVSSEKLDVSYGSLNADLVSKVTPGEVFPNDSKGFKKLCKWVKQFDSQEVSCVFVMEATGVYHQKLVEFLYSKNLESCVVLPNKVKSFKDSYNTKTKTDAVDCRLICKMGLERELRFWKPGEAHLNELRELSREKARKVDNRAQAKNRIHALKASALPNKSAIRRLKQEVAFFDRHVESINKEIEQIVDQHEDLKEKVDRISEVKGLGKQTVSCIIGELGGFQWFSNSKQLTSFAGLDVIHNDSGKKIGKSRISKKGNKYIRKLLYMPALSAARFDPHLSAFYQRLLEKGLKKKQALAAVMRKLLLLIFSLYKSGQAYDPNRHTMKTE